MNDIKYHVLNTAKGINWFFLQLFPYLAARETASATPSRVEYKIMGYYNFCTNVADYQYYAIALP